LQNFHNGLTYASGPYGPGHTRTRIAQERNKQTQAMSTKKTPYKVESYAPVAEMQFETLRAAQEWLDEHAAEDSFHVISSNHGQHEDDAELEAVYAPGGGRIDLNGIAAPIGSFCDDAIPCDDLDTDEDGLKVEEDEPPTSVISGGQVVYPAEQEYDNARFAGEFMHAADIAEQIAKAPGSTTLSKMWLDRAFHMRKLARTGTVQRLGDD
jgi:hypothetical protein